MPKPDWALIKTFTRESNAIEGIYRDPLGHELQAHMDLLVAPVVDVDALVRFVGLVQGDAELRVRPGLNVRVGDHVAPPGGYAVRAALNELLERIRTRRVDAFDAHREYLHLHPFTDGNGRSSRVLWLWQVRRDGRHHDGLSFLQAWYYQSLAHYDRTVADASRTPR